MKEKDDPETLLSEIKRRNARGGITLNP